MPTYINRNSYSVHLNGPDGETIVVNSKQVIELPEYYQKYAQRGFITLINGNIMAPQTRIEAIRKSVTQKVIRQGRNINATPPPSAMIKEISEIPARQSKIRNNPQHVTRKPSLDLADSVPVRHKLGANVQANYLEVYKSFASKHQYSISNDVGVGILTFNRPKSLKRLLQSIDAFTDLNNTVVFISDDNSTDPDQIALLDSLDKSKYVILRNTTRAGIAGNSNRLLKCLKRFNYGILLNDDVEVLRNGWDTFYGQNMAATGLKHFIYREDGVYGAVAATPSMINDKEVAKVDSKPHGAVLAFDNTVDVGYFDEGFGIYGMEHVEWSDRFHKDGHQAVGYFDAKDSSDYFKIHAESSAVIDRVTHLAKAKAYLAAGSYNRTSKYADVINSISVVVPIRVFARQQAIDLIVKNLKALKFPHVEIILSEHDVEKNFVNRHVGIQHIFTATNSQSTLFNKAMAFNVGVNASSANNVILHDADLMAHDDYANYVYDKLQKYEACHIGKFVIYLDKDETDSVVSNGLTRDPSFERMVGYYEGGSIGVRKRNYWACGAFNEEFYGYGNEDTEFFGRLSRNTHFCNERTEAFIHLWHPRVANWTEHHNDNKALERRLVAMTMEQRLAALANQNARRGYKCEC